ncbi:hypothetical protein MASR2M44_13740 [Bacteroidota bacterium]
MTVCEELKFNKSLAFNTMKTPALLLGLLLLLSCSKPSSHSKLGYYWWKTNANWNDEDNFSDYIPLLKKSKASTIYYKLYDIDWSAQLGIYPETGPGEPKYEDFFEQVPVVFITNRVFEQANAQELEMLAAKIRERIPAETKEVQIDCDWTQTTRDAYFNFLKKLKSKDNSFNVSVTLRLYAYKYRKSMGVPPVDKAALMLYNFESPKIFREENSIFDYQLGLSYLKGQEKYPLPLDFILPSFQWTVLFNNRQFVSLLRNQDSKSLSEFCEIKRPGIFKSERDTVLEGNYIRKGQVLKLESCGMKELKEALKLVDEAKNSSTYSLSIFSLNPLTRNQLNSHESLEMLYPAAN